MVLDGDRRSPSAASTRGSRLAFHALTVLAVLVCLVAARWQWERAHRTEAEAVPDTPVIALADLDPQTAYAGLRVRLDGTFDPAGEVLVAPRSRDGAPGAWVLTPLRPDGPSDAAAVAVVRGWVPQGVEPTPPPAGPVSVVAVLVADSRQPGVAPSGAPPTRRCWSGARKSWSRGAPTRSAPRRGAISGSTGCRAGAGTAPD